MQGDLSADPVLKKHDGGRRGDDGVEEGGEGGDGA